MSESLYVAEVSPMHKDTFTEEFNSSLTIKSSLRSYGYTGCSKKSKSNGIANHLSNVFLIAFSCVVTISGVPSDFFAATCAFNPLAGCMLEVTYRHVLFHSGNDPCTCHKCMRY